MTHASNARKDTTSIKTECAARFREPASNSTFRKEFAKNALKDTQLLTANALKSIQLLHPTLAAPDGPMESAKPAPRDGISTKKKSASLLVIFATPGTKPPDSASPAITDLSSKTETVWLILILALSPKATFFAKHGLQTLAFNAQQEVSSTLTDSVFQLALSAILSIKLLETA